MTVKELIRELQNVPEDAIVLGDSHLYQYNCIVDGIDYDDATNTISFYGGDIFEFQDEETDIPDDVDETNYNPYMGCDDYEVDMGFFEDF